MPTPLDRQQIAAHLTELYTLQCRAALNKDYYGALLARYQSINTWIEILIAAGTTGSGLSAISDVWSTRYGQYLWGMLALTSAILAIAKPILQLNQTIEQFSKLFTGHSDIYASLLLLTSRIKRRAEMTDEMVSTFEAAELRFLELAQEDHPKPNLKILRRCEEAVRKRHPPEEAWYPDAGGDQSGSTPPVAPV
jgi:hypothetical protein